MTRTACTVLAGILLAFLLSPALAGACNYPTLGLNKGEAGPGDLIVYTITDAQAGAEYTVTIAGREIVRGTSRGADGHSGTFQMPDLGSSQRVSVELVVTHSGAEEPGHETGPWRDSESLDFRSPSTDTAAPSDGAGPDGSPPPTAAGARAELPAGAATPSPQDLRTPQGSAPASTRARADHTPAAPRTASRHRAADAPRAVASAPVGTAPRSDPAPATRRARRHEIRAASPETATQPDASPAAATERPVAPGTAPAALPVAPVAATGPSALVIAGLVLLVGILMQACGVLTRPRGRPVVASHTAPDPPEPVAAADVEAELQEMLTAAASERALEAAERAPEAPEPSTTC